MRVRLSLTLLAAPLVFVSCSHVTTASKTPPTTSPATVQTPALPSLNAPLNTSAAAAPANAKVACEYLKATVDQLSSDDRLVNEAVASAQAGVNSALAAFVNDPSYTKLRIDAVAL